MAPPYQDAADGKITSLPGAASGVRPRYLLCPALHDSSPPQPCPTHVQSGQLMELGNKERELHAAAMFLSADIAARLPDFLSAVDSHRKIFFLRLYQQRVAITMTVASIIYRPHPVGKEFVD